MQKLLVPALLGLSVAALFARQEPATPAGEPVQVVVLPPRRDPWWDSVVLDHDLPHRLLTVPAGRRFVLTDLWTTSHEQFRAQLPTPQDRLWLEDAGGGRRKVVFDALAGELPLPLRWQSGVAFEAGHEVWVSYRFGGEGKSEWVRRLHVSGYFEEAPPAE